MSFSPSGQLLATGGKDGTVRLWDLSGRQLAAFNGAPQAVISISFSSDERYMTIRGKSGKDLISRIKSLDELLREGCDRLKDYFVTHPQALAKLKVCQK